MRYTSKREWLIMDNPILKDEVGAEVLAVSPIENENGFYLAVFDGVHISKVQPREGVGTVFREPKNEEETNMCVLSEIRLMIADATKELDPANGRWIDHDDISRMVSDFISNMLSEALNKRSRGMIN